MAETPITNRQIRDLKRTLRQAASEYSFALSSDLEAMGLERMQTPPKRTLKRSRTFGRKSYTTGSARAGEWDWFDRLHPEERRRLRENWSTPNGLSPDQMQMAGFNGEMGFGSVDEAAETYARMTSQIDALGVFAKTGKIPSTKKYAAAGNFYRLLENSIISSNQLQGALSKIGLDFEELSSQGFNVEQFLNSQNQKEYLRSISEIEFEDPEEAHYRSLYESEMESTKAEIKTAKTTETEGQRRARELREQTQARIASKKAKNNPGNIVDNAEILPDDDYYASLEYSPENLVDEIIPENFSDSSFIDDIDNIIDIDRTPQPFEDLIGLADAKTMEAAEEAAKSNFKPIFPKLHARLSSALDQGIDLAVEVSKDVSGGSATGKQMLAEGSAATRKFISSNRTTQNVIKSMNDAIGVVKGLSAGKKIGYTVGGLAAVGAVSGRNRERRKQ